MDQNLKSATMKLLAYCESSDWAGYDPYDALNSKLFKKLPILQSKIPQLVLTQLLKRSPINMRGLMLVPKTQNPKALALFLTSFLNLANAGIEGQDARIEHMIELLQTLRAPEDPHWCWGYSFPWQGRSLLTPAGAANLVCTTFVANSLFDVYEQRQDARCLAMALSATEYIRDVLYWEDGEMSGFCYPLPGMRGTTHNANLLASAILCRAYKHTGHESYLGPAFTAARFSVGKQREDGSWWYGEAPTQRWIDNFHTGYNLSALRDIGRFTGSTEFESAMQRGFVFYRANFFREDGAAKYFHNNAYPLDIHCVAQSILTLLEFRDLDATNEAQAQAVYRWAMKHMWDDEGYFYYRVLRSCTIRTPYMRWSEAWMLLALSTLLLKTQTAAPVAPVGSTTFV